MGPAETAAESPAETPTRSAVTPSATTADESPAATAADPSATRAADPPSATGAPSTPRPPAGSVSDPRTDAEPVPDPFTDADALDELACRITGLEARVQVATHRLLVLLADFDRRRGWELGGHRSCADWYHVATGASKVTARERVRVARALGGLPGISAAMARGALLMRAIEAASDALFRKNDPAADETTPRQRRADALGLLAERALAAGFGGELGREEAADARESARCAKEPEKAGGDARAPAGPAKETDEPVDDARASPSSPVPISGTRAERYQVLLLVRPEGLRSDGAEGRCGSGGKEGGRSPTEDRPGEGENPRKNAPENGEGAHPGGGCRPVPVAHLDDGTRLGRETARRLSCDVATVRLTLDGDGGLLDMGRRTRTVPSALRRVLELRDGGCRFPGCGLRFTDAHHIVHWSDGGETALDNLLLLCRHHHRLLHEGGWSVHLGGRARGRIPPFVDPRGRFHAEPERGRRVHGWTPPGERGRRLVGGLRGEDGDGPARPDPWSLHADYARAADVPWAIRARAREALDEAHFGESA